MVVLLAVETCEVVSFKLQFLALQVHMCNKLASRHVRVGLADPSVVPHCDICENAPGLSLTYVSSILPRFMICILY